MITVGDSMPVNFTSDDSSSNSAGVGELLFRTQTVNAVDSTSTIVSALALIEAWSPARLATERFLVCATERQVTVWDADQVEAILAL